MQLFGVSDWNDVLVEFREGGRLENRWGFLLMLQKLKGFTFVTGPAEMVRLYESARARPYGRFDQGYPLGNDELMMTLSAAMIDGQLTLVEHFDDGATSPISVFEAGQIGDVWTAYNDQRESSPFDNEVDYGHGFLSGVSGDIIITFDPNRFDSLGAWLDGGGIIAGLIFPPAGTVVGCVEVARSWPKFAVPLAQGRPISELGGPFRDLVLDVGGLFSPAADVVDLFLNFSEGAHIDLVP